MNSESDNETTNDMSCVKVGPRCKQQMAPSPLILGPPTSSSFVSVGKCDSYNGIRIRDNEEKSLFGYQYGPQYHRRLDKAMRTLFVMTAVAATICHSSARSPIIFVNSFSFKLFHRSGGRRQEQSTENAAQIILLATSSSSAEEDVEKMNNSLKNSIKNAKYKSNNNRNNNPSLADWKVDSDGKRITGRAVNHPLVPDGELITTAFLDPSCMEGGLEDGDIVSTIKGTKYELLKPPPVGSSYFPTTSPSTSNNKDQIFNEDVFSYTTMGLAYDQQLAFLEELTDMVKTMQAAETGTTASASITNPSDASSSVPVVTASVPAPLPIPSTLEQQRPQEFIEGLSSTVDQLESESQQQQVQVQTTQPSTQQQQQTSEEPPQRPTFSINKSQPNREQNQMKEKPSSSNSNESGDNGSSVLGSVATLAAAAAAVTLGGQTGIGTELLDDAKRQVESQMSPQTKELIASVNTKVQEQSNIVLPYLEEQIRIAEAKVEEARLEEKAKEAWNGVAEYLNEQSRSTAAKEALVTSTTSSEATKTMDSIAVEEVTSTSSVIAASSTPALDNEITLFEKSLDKAEDGTISSTTGTEVTAGSTSVVADKQLSAEMPTGVETEKSVTKDSMKEPTSATKIIEEVMPTTPSEGVKTAATIEEALAATAVISSNSLQPFEGEQSSQESKQVKATEKVGAETLQVQATEKAETEVESEVFRLQGVEKTEVEADAVVQTAEKAKAEAVQVQADDKAEAEVVRIQAIETREDDVVQEAAEKAKVEAVQVQDMEKAEPEIEVLRVQAAEKAEAEAEVLRVSAIAEEQELAEATRIVAEQLEVARREVEQAVIQSMEAPAVVESPLVTETNIAKVEVVKGSGPLTKSAPSVVETFGGNFVVAQEESKLGSAEIPSTASGTVTVGVSENNVEKPTSEMVKDAITVEVAPVVDTSLIDKEEASRTTTDLSETPLNSRSVSASTEIKALETVENSQVAKATGVLEKGKKTTESIVDAGREAMDTGKRTVQSIKTNGNVMINSSKRTYQTAVDTGREVIDTGKRTAKAIEETAQTVSAKGKEVYETGQKYAGIVNEKIPVIIESGEKAAAAINAKVPDLVEAGKEILEDEQKVEAIVAGSAAAGVAVAYATASFRTEDEARVKSNSGGKVEDDIQSDVAETEKAIPSLSMNGGNESFARVMNNGENPMSQTTVDLQTSTPQTLSTSASSSPSEAASIPYTAKSGTTSNATPPSENSTSKKTSQEVIEPEMLSSVPSPKTVTSSMFGVMKDDVIDTTSTDKPDGNQEKNRNSSFPTPKSFPSQASQKNNDFGVASVPSSKTTINSTFPTPKPFPPSFGIPNSKTSPKEIEKKRVSSFNEKGYGGSSPKSSDSGKQTASPFGSPPRQAAPGKQVAFGVPSSKSTDYGKQAASPFGSPPKQASSDKKVAFGVPSSKSTDYGKQAASPFGSPPKQAAPGKEVAFGVPSSKSSGSGKQAASPFGSLPKSGGFDKQSESPFGSPPKQAAPDKQVGFGIPSSKSSSFDKQSDSPFGSPPKQAIKQKPLPLGSKSSTKKFGVSSMNGKMNQTAPKDKMNQTTLPKIGIPPRTLPSMNTETVKVSPANTGAKFPLPPKVGAGPRPKIADGTNLSVSPKEESSLNSNLASSPTLKVPKKVEIAEENEAEISPFTTESSPKKPKFEVSSTLELLTNDESSTENEKNKVLSTEGKIKSPFPPRAPSTSNFNKGKEKASFDVPSGLKTPEKADVGAGKSASPFAKDKTKSPFPPKAASTPTFNKGEKKLSFDGPSGFKTPEKAGVGAGKSASPFAKGKTKSPFPPKAPSTPTFNKGEKKLSFDGPSGLKTPEKAGVGAGKSASPFAKGKTKSPFPPKAASTPNFNTNGKGKSSFDGASGLKTGEKTGVEAEKRTSPFAKGKTKSPFPPKAASTPTFNKGKEKLSFNVPSGLKTLEKTGVEVEKRTSPFAKDETKTLSPKDTSTAKPKEMSRSYFTDTKSPFPPKAASTPNFNNKGKDKPNFNGPSGFKTPEKTGAEAENRTSPFAKDETKTLSPKDTSATKPNFGSSSTQMLSNEASDKSSKETGRSYFTDTSKNVYDDQRSTSYGSAEYGDASNNDQLNDRDAKQFSSEQDLAKETSSSYDTGPLPAESVRSTRSSIDDDRELVQEFTYLTEENQRSFFPKPISAQPKESVYRVGASIEENQEEFEPIPLEPRSADSKPRIASSEESAFDSDGGMYGKSPDELMAEVMRIAREQEERKAR